MGPLTEALLSLALGASVLLTGGAARFPFMAPDEMERAARTTGLPLDGVRFEVQGAEYPNAGFIPAGYCSWFECQEYSTVVFLGDWSRTPYEVRLFVLMHELGHYRQLLEGRSFEEWDADLYAAERLCAMGYDGLYWAEATARFLLEAYGRSWSDGGEEHGSWAARVENVRAKARGCSLPMAPFA
jgi:hypothetical protein